MTWAAVVAAFTAKGNARYATPWPRTYQPHPITGEF